MRCIQNPKTTSIPRVNSAGIGMPATVPSRTSFTKALSATVIRRLSVAQRVKPTDATIVASVASNGVRPTQTTRAAFTRPTATVAAAPISRAMRSVCPDTSWSAMRLTPSVAAAGRLMSIPPTTMSSPPAMTTTASPLARIASGALWRRMLEMLRQSRKNSEATAR